MNSGIVQERHAVLVLLLQVLHDAGLQLRDVVQLTLRALDRLHILLQGLKHLRSFLFEHVQLFRAQLFRQVDAPTFTNAQGADAPANGLLRSTAPSASAGRLHMPSVRELFEALPPQLHTALLKHGLHRRGTGELLGQILGHTGVVCGQLI